MSKKQKKISSKEAASTFKRSIDKSLRLLGFLNDSEKEELWKYWKAVSSAVKIAVEGKGDVTSFLHRNHGGKDPNEATHKNISEGIITICVPLNQATDSDGQRRFRILGFHDQKVTDDYIEAIDTCNKLTIEDSTQLRPIPTDLVSQICQLCDYSIISNTGVVIKEIETCEYQTDTCSSSVISLNNSNTSVDDSQFCASLNEVLTVEKNDSLLLKKEKSGEKSLSFEKPATRFSFRVKERNSVNNLVPVKMREIRVGLKTDEMNNPRPEICDIIGSGSTTSISSLKGSMEQCQNPSLFAIETDKVSQNLKNKKDSICSDENPACHLEPQSKGVDEEISNNSVQPENDEIVNNSFTEAVLNTETMYPTNNETTSVLVNSGAFDDAHSDDVKAPASDIETIISALEEELKKTGSSAGIHSISITSSENGGASMDFHTTCKGDDIQQDIPVSGSQEMVIVQNVGDVIWTPTSDESAQVIDASVGGVHFVTSEVASGEFGDDTLVQSSIDAQYDVVEYEVQAENSKARRSLGNRKRKRDKDVEEEQPVTKNKDTLDRTCPMCHRVLTYPSSMAAHMRIHTGDRPYSCGQCDRKFTTKANRDRHEATHIGLKPFKCTECEKCFTEKRSLTIHMRCHTGERPYVCSVCHRGFAQKCTLMVHMDRHTNKKGHLCDLCGKAFRQKSQLDVHVKRHNRQANYPCPECSIKCYTKGDLDRHMIKHTGERPFVCSVCTKTFTRKQYLMDHENAHFDRKPYKCSICGMTFHDMGSCHRHVKKHRDRDEDSHKGENGLKKEPATILTADDYNSIVKDSQAGKILTLEDGTQALVTAVDTEADGVTVYHVTCVHNQQGDEVKPETVTGTEEMLETSSITEGKDLHYDTSKS